MENVLELAIDLRKRHYEMSEIYYFLASIYYA